MQWPERRFLMWLSQAMEYDDTHRLSLATDLATATWNPDGLKDRATSSQSRSQSDRTSPSDTAAAIQRAEEIRRMPGSGSIKDPTRGSN